MIVLAHIGFVPVEEFLTPIASGMTAGMIVLGSVVARLRYERKPH